MNKFAAMLRRIARAIARALGAALGSVSITYKPPAWTKAGRAARAERPARARPTREAAHVEPPSPMRKLFLYAPFSPVLLAAVAAVVVLSLPKGLDVTVAAPAARELRENSEIPPLGISFSGSAARIELVEKTLDKGVRISPEIKGRWLWMDDKSLVFAPAEDWEAGREYGVSMDASIFSDKVRISRRTLSFRTAELRGKIEDARFYIDPAHPEIKRITATVSFTHPVKTADVERAVKLDVPFSVSYDKFLAKAYIVSANVPVPEKTSKKELRVSGRINPSLGGAPYSADLKTTVVVPGRTDYAALSEIRPELIRGENFEYRKLLVASSNLGVRPPDLHDSLTVFLLPKDRPETPGAEEEKDHGWAVEEVDNHVLALSSKVELEPQPIEGDFGTEIGFSYNAPSGRFLYLEAGKGIEAIGGYTVKPGYKTVVQVPEIPREVKIMHEGALLSMSGEKKISLYANDIEHVRFEIGRIIPDQVSNLITLTGGDLKDAYLDDESNFGVENISAIYRETRRLKKLDAGLVQYFSFDFDRYLNREADPRLKYGLFYFKVLEYNPETKETGPASSARLILVTDLGVLAKKNASIGYDVFVQSIHSGGPVEGASVEVVGKNGLSVVSAATDSDGHVFIPKLDDFTREKTPEAFVVRKGSDMSFLPVNGASRFLNLSRFDIGGVYGTADPGFIDAYLFSDRGIYRPGDLMEFGVIVKAGDWTKNISGLPLELAMEDPRGLEIQKQKISLSPSGFEQYSFKTLDTAQTGTYRLTLSIARDKEERKLLGSVSVKVEEFQPDRLSIRSSFSGDTDRAWISPKDLKATVSLMNLFGTPAAGNTVQARISLSPAAIWFPKYPDYRFFDPYETSKYMEDRLPDAKTDGAGNAAFPIDLERFEKATFWVQFTADGLEKQGGRGVQTQSSIVVSPLSSVVGYSADGALDYIFKGAERTVRFLAVGPEGNATALSGLDLNVAEIRFVSVLEKGPDGLFRYKSVEKKTHAGASAMTIPVEGFAWKPNTDSPGDFEATVTDKSGARLAVLRYTVIGSGNLSRSLDRNAELQVRLDKDDYDAAGLIEVSVKAPYAGAGLITIERDRVYAYKWFSARTTATVQTMRIPDDLEGTAYLNVSFIRALDSPEIYSSPLSYGVVPFSINKSRRVNRITLGAAEEAPAGKPLRFTYSTEKPARIVVFAVDEGILQVARYATPDPLEHFFTKRALEVETSQILDLILPEFSVARAASATGGDEGGEELARNLNPFKRGHKAPVAFWSGILPSDNTERTVEYRVPDYFNGTLRVMAVTVADDSIGVRQERTVVRNHFVLSPNVPPVVSPMDEVEIGLGVMNDLDTKDAETEVRVQMKPSDQFEVLKDGAAAVKIGRKQEKTFFFTVRVKNVLGAGSFAFTASGGGKSSTMTETVSIRPSMPYRTELETGKLKGGSAEVAIKRKMHPDFRALEANASYLPSGIAYGLKKFLDSYPYGCTEQIVSRAFPSLALRRQPDFGVSEKDALDAFAFVQKVLRFRQNQDGSFGLWAANGIDSAFITAYAMHYLTDAREAGYPVDRDLFAGGLAALRAIAGEDPEYEHTPFDAAAYAIYVLTRNGAVTTSYINALREAKGLGREWRQGPVAAYLAGAYALLKQQGEARSLLSAAFSADQRAYVNEYYSDLSQSALCLYMAARHVPEISGALADKAVERIADGVTQGKYNTISSAYSILGLTSYSATAALSSGERLRIYAKAEKEYEELKRSGQAVMKAAIPYGSSGVKIDNPAQDTVYYQVVQSGFDLEPPASVAKKGIEAFREYVDENGKPVQDVPIGSEIRARVRIRSIDPKKPKIYNVAIVDMLPSGFELVFDRAGSAPALGRGSTPAGYGTLQVDYVEPREDRILIFCTAESALKEFSYVIRPANKGRFAVPPVFAEAMYDKTIWTQHPSEGFLTVKE